jgi:hypothetical protein
MSMFSEQDVENILRSIVKLNTAMGIYSVLIPLVFAAVIIVLLVRAYRYPGTKSSAALLSSLGAIYLYSGWTIFSGQNEMGATEAWVGAIALWLVAILLIADSVFHWTHIHWPRRLDLQVLSVFFMVGGIFIYPL